MFWSLNVASARSLSTLLDNDSFTLEELLEEEELLQECKAQNDKLISFLTQPETMVKLITYIVEMPQEADSEPRRFKYPYVASEVLACDVQAFRDELLSPQQGHLLEQILSILEQPAPLAPVLIGYCSKVLVSLFKSSPDAFMQYFTNLWAQQREDSPLSIAKLLPRLLTHMGSDAVLQLLIMLCVGEPPMLEAGAVQMQPPTSATWLPHDDLIPSLLDNLSAADAESVQNSAVLLCSILEQSTAVPSCLSEPSDQVQTRCEGLVRVCLGGEGGEEGVLNLAAMDVLLKVLEQCRELKVASSPGGCTSLLLQAVTANVERFFMALATPAVMPPRFSRFLNSLPPAEAEVMPRPRAPQRCRLLDLFQEAVRSESMPLLQALCELELFHIVLALLLLPHNCNVLHMRAARIIEASLYMEGECAAMLQQALLHEARLAPRVLEFLVKAPGMQTRPSCHGFVMTLAGVLVEAAGREPRVGSALEGCDGWAAFVAPGGPLARWDEIQQKPLGGRMPTRTTDADDDSDNDVDFDSAQEVERVLAAQAAAMREQSNQGIGGVGSADDDERDDEAGSSSEYLEHHIQYLSQRNFVDDVSQDLDTLHESTLQDASAGATDAQWNAEFDFDDAEFSAPNGEPFEAPPCGPAAGALFDIDSSSSVTKSSEDAWAADFEQISVSGTSDPIGAAESNDDGWAAFSSDVEFPAPEDSGATVAGTPEPDASTPE